jgi:DNA-binding NtrC family response regulator
VRELAHAMERAVVLSRGGRIEVDHLPPDLSSAAPAPDSTAVRPLALAIDEFEREYLVRTLRLTGGRRGRAAELLGISRKNLWEKLRAHGIVDADFDELTGPVPLIDRSGSKQ